MNDDSYERLLALFEGRDARAALPAAARVILLLAGRLDEQEFNAALADAEAAGVGATVGPGELLHYGYFRSSADYRVRIALRLKRAELARAFVHLRKGEQRGDAFRRVNPAGLVPALVRGAGADNRVDDKGVDKGVDNGKDNGVGWEGVLTQSLAIIEYLNDLLPRPDLLPGDAWRRAEIRAAALEIACDVHPLCNLRVLNRLRSQFGADDAAVREWMAEWTGAGLAALEARLAARPAPGKLMFGDAPTLAEVCLIPQIYNAKRFGIDLSPYPRTMRIYDACMKNRAFREAAPEHQPDCDLQRG